MNFYSPNSFKKGRFIANRFRLSDLLILIAGWVITLFSELIYLTNFENLSFSIFVLMLLPACVCTFLVLNFGIYLNFHEFFRLLIRFKKKNNNYIWEGIYKYEEKD